MARRPISDEERADIARQRGALREKEELARLEDEETERLIKAGEIEDPDSSDADFIYEGDENDDDQESDVTDDESGGDESIYADVEDAGDGAGDEGDDGGESEIREGGDGEDELATAGSSLKTDADLAAMEPSDLAAYHLRVVGREPHEKAKKQTIINNIRRAQALAVKE